MLNFHSVGKAQVTTKGILFFDLFYSCNRAISEQWFDKARESGNWIIEVYFNPINLSKIFYRTISTSNEFEVCNVILHETLERSKVDEYFKGMQKLKILRENNRRKMTKNID